MKTIEFSHLPPPELLKNDVVSIRIARYWGEEGFDLKTSLNGLPGIVFQHHEGRSPVEEIVTPVGSNRNVPTLYLYGQITTPSVMKHQGPYTMTQVLLKPHALQTLLGLDAICMTNRMVELDEFSADALNDQLLDAKDTCDQVTLLSDFLLAKLKQERRRDRLVEESLRLIHKHSASIQLKWLLEHLGLSERHFERRFQQTVGLSPHFYIRVKRFNEAVRLMKAGEFARLAEVAQALNFYDESHFSRDIKAFSGMTPKALLKKEDDFLHGEAGYTYL